MNRREKNMNEQYPLPLKATVLALALSAAMIPSRSRAADITVDASGTCTLAEAITSANNDNAAGNGCVDGSGADTITLEKDVVLASLLPDITTEITIEGAGHTIDGNNAVNTVLTIRPSSGDLTLNEATVTGSTGNGILVSSPPASPSSSVTVNNSTISGNTESGISSSSSFVTLNNSTISGNTGSGIYSSSSSVTVNNSTISDNTGSGIYSDAPSYFSSSVTVNNSTISGNTGSSANEIRISGSGSNTVTVDAYNVFGHSGETNAQAFSGFTPGVSDVNATSDGGGTPTALAAILSPLADNGGPTETHALPAGSPAIDLDPTCGTGQTEDQRGYCRPFGTGCDAGSFEVSGACGCGRDLPAKTWLMTAPSCTPSPTGISDQYGTDLGGIYRIDWISFKWDANSTPQQYIQQAATDPLELGIGNWGYSSNAGTLSLSGTATPTEDCSGFGWSGQTCHAIDLTPAPDSSTNIWQMVGHPFPSTVDWTDVRIASFNGSTWTAHTPSEAETEGLSREIYYRWNGNAYESNDEATLGMEGVLQAQEAIWFKILSGSSSLLPGNFKLLIPETEAD